MKKIIFAIMVFICINSCTKKFDEINTNPVAVTTIGPSEIRFLFTRGINWAVMASDDYQVGQNLFADQYCQYWANATTYFQSDRFVMVSGWIDQFFPAWYSKAAPALYDVLRFTDENSSEHAIASIMWVYLFHNVTDCWGPVPYFEVGKKAPFVPYDAQDKIYNDFFKRLTDANNILKTHSTETPFGTNDLIYQGNINKWRKFANSLRLRLALRISKADAVKAKTEAEAAVAAGVFMQSPDDDALILRTKDDYDYSHHIAAMSDWGEFGMSAAMESYLKGFNDPRMQVWFSPTKNTRGSANPEYHGIRNGLLADDFTDTKNKLDNNSIAGFRWNNQFNSNSYNTPQNMMCTAETYFLRAEGTLNGWNMGGGTATELYNEGIRQSFLQWGVTDDPTTYLSSTSTPIALNDFLSSPAVNTISVKFGASETIQREQIGTQKWLAMFPDGFAGWAEKRRTGYPKLYPVPNSDNPDIAPGGLVRRLPYANYEYNNNAKGVEIGLQLLGGDDNVNTRLWWDKP